MKELIAIKDKQVGEDLIKTVNARDLHEFLGVRKDFSNWIKVQVQRARLTEEQDFVVFAQKGENPEGGRPTTEYHLTLEAGKHIAMMSGTEKGNDVRDYFIECERIATSAPQPTITPELRTSKQLREVNQVTKEALIMAKNYGLDLNAARIAANRATRKITGVDPMALLEMKGIERPIEDLPLTPTEVGKLLGGLSPQMINKTLISLGYQDKVGTTYAPTPKGSPLAVLLDTEKKSRKGTPIVQLKWKRSIVDHLLQ